jgi:hypothetical protein
MLFAFVALVCALSVPLTGGRLTRLADYSFRGAGLAIAGLALQVIVISVAPKGARWAHEAIHLGSYLLVGAVVVLNRRLPYLWLIGLGGLCNFVAISANGGVMPATASAVRAGGSLPPHGEFINSTVLAHPHLQFLGDVFAIPAPWAHNIFSVGDIVMAAGALLCVNALCRWREEPDPDPGLTPLVPSSG